MYEQRFIWLTIDFIEELIRIGVVAEEDIWHPHPVIVYADVVDMMEGKYRETQAFSDTFRIRF